MRSSVCQRRCVVLYARGMINKRRSNPHRLVVYPMSANHMDLPGNYILCHWLDVPDLTKQYKSLNGAAEAMRLYNENVASYISQRPHPGVRRASCRREQVVDGRNAFAFVNRHGKFETIRDKVDFSDLIQLHPHATLDADAGSGQLVVEEGKEQGEEVDVASRGRDGGDESALALISAPNDAAEKSDEDDEDKDEGPADFLL